MPNGYSPKDIIRESKILAVPANQQVSKQEGLTAGGATVGFRIDIECESTAGVVDFRIQEQTLGSWTDLVGANATVAAADGIVSLKQLALKAADQPNFPCQKQIRVLANGAGSTTVTRMTLLQEL